MKKAIGTTNFYSIEIDVIKNRAYLTLTGFCKGPEDIPEFLNDVKKACQGLKKGFTLLTDASKLKVPSREVGELFEKSQQIWISGGLVKTAEVIPESNVVRMALDRSAKDTGMPKKGFTAVREAESWLDSGK